MQTSNTPPKKAGNAPAKQKPGQVAAKQNPVLRQTPAHTAKNPVKAAKTPAPVGKPQVFYTGSAQQSMQLAQRLAQLLKPGDIVAFTGGLGVGKTTFCRGLALGLHVQDPVSSPSFAIVNYYRGALPLAHFDAYRIQSEEDLENAGFYCYQEAGAVLAVEWSENIHQLLPQPYIMVDIQVGAGGKRKVSIWGAPLK